jgi:hypothetical protein
MAPAPVVAAVPVKAAETREACESSHAASVVLTSIELASHANWPVPMRTPSSARVAATRGTCRMGIEKMIL